jgi:hypothetical protein
LDNEEGIEREHDVSVVANGSDCRVSMGVRAEYELDDWWPAHRMVVVGMWNVGFGRKD